MSKRPPIILIGFKGCGKSLIGGLLAQQLGEQFVDTDTVLENLYERREGERLHFREIFKKTGPEYFRALEIDAVREAVAGDSRVIAFGGGTLMNLESAVVKVDALFVYITVEKETLFQRIMNNGVPAFLDPARPRESFEEYYSRRAPVYERYATVTVDNTDKTPAETAMEIAMEVGRI